MSQRILIVEDSKPVQEVVCEFLSEEGYVCDAMDTGSDAIRQLQQETYDLVITDLRLPGADGFDVVEVANKVHPLTPKIIMTARSDLEDALRALRLGAYDFVRKPIRNMWELGVIVSRALEHRRLLLERKNRERELEEEVRRRTEELSRANLELKTLDEMKNNLLANVSHELRTPLVSVRGYTELFHTGRLCPIPEDCQKYLTTSLRNIDKLLALIESLVSYAELARTGVSLALETVDLGEVAERLAADIAVPAKEAGLSVNLSTPEEPIPVKVDRSRLVEAVQQIANNAVKFNSSAGEIHINVVLVGQRLAKFILRDTGMGIAPEHQARIFDQFYQVDGSPTRHHGGTGIGLAIARDNLRLIGCELRVSSNLEEGSTFYFTIPTVGLPTGEGEPLPDGVAAGADKA